MRPRYCRSADARMRMQNALLAAVFQTLDSAIHRIKIYPMDSVIGLPNTYPLDSTIQRLNNRGLLVYTCQQVVINASQFSREQMRLVFIYRRLVLSSTPFGKRDNLKLLDSIVTMKTLVGKKYYSFRRRFAKTRGAVMTKL